MSTGYIIIDTETGGRFRADSGKTIWASQGGAKIAWRASWMARRLPYSTQSESFNAQTRYIVEELSSHSGQLDTAKKLLKDALNALCDRHADECDEAEAIRAFLGMESQV